MNPFSTIVLVFALLLGACPNADAEVVEVDVTVKAVDPTSRSLTVQHKGKESKLDVSRKAVISINDKPGTLKDLKPGQTATVEFETDFAIITNVAVSGDGEAAGGCIFRGLSISISQSGECLLVVDSQDPPNGLKRFDGEIQDMKIFGDSNVLKLADGRLNVISDFAKLGNASGMISQSLSDEKRKLIHEHMSVEDDLLILSPKQEKRVSFGLPRAFIAPIDLRLSLAGHRDGAFLVQFGIDDRTLVIGIHGENSPERNIAPGTVLISERNKQGEFRQLFQAVQPAGKLMQYEFQVDPPQANRVYASLGLLSDLPLAIRRMNVAAKFPPSFGMALEQRGQRVLVKRTIVGNAAASAGIKSGDVILQVDGVSANSMQQVLDILAAKVIGDEVALIIERFGRRKVISVVPN